MRVPQWTQASWPGKGKQNKLFGNNSPSAFPIQLTAEGKSGWVFGVVDRYSIHKTETQHVEYLWACVEGQALCFPQLVNSHKWKWSAQLCLTLCDPMDCSLPGSSIHRIFQARVLEWLSFSSPEFPWLKPIPGVCFILIHNLSYRWFLPLFSFHSTSHPGKKVRWPRNYPDWNPGSPKAKPLSLTHPGTEGPRSLIQLALEGKLRSVHQGHT